MFCSWVVGYPAPARILHRSMRASRLIILPLDGRPAKISASHSQSRSLPRQTASAYRQQDRSCSAAPSLYRELHYSVSNARTTSMMHDAIRQHFTNCGAENLLDLLPALESMEWITHPTAYLQSALVVGCQDDCLILAFARSSRDRPVELCYCSIPKHDNLVRSWIATDLTQDAVEGSQLIPPFKYNAGTLQNGQSTFHTVVQWYFMGLGGGGIKCSIDEYCPKLLDALRHIETRQQLEKSGTSYIATVMENANGETGALTTQEWFSAVDSRPVAACEDEASDYRTLLEYLEDELLESIPGPDVVEFVIQRSPSTMLCQGNC